MRTPALLSGLQVQGTASSPLGTTASLNRKPFPQSQRIRLHIHNLPQGTLQDFPRSRDHCKTPGFPPLAGEMSEGQRGPTGRPTQTKPSIEVSQQSPSAGPSQNYRHSAGVTVPFRGERGRERAKPRTPDNSRGMRVGTRGKMDSPNCPGFPRQRDRKPRGKCPGPAPYPDTGDKGGLATRCTPEEPQAKVSLSQAVKHVLGRLDSNGHQQRKIRHH